MKYNKLTVVSTFKKKRNPRGYREFANCLCECGKESIVQMDNLKSGHTKSCGCDKISLKHGLSYHPLYKVWEGIVARCENKNSKAFKYYGGRGITMYKPWRDNAGEFINWAVENGWIPGLTIERNEVNGNYEPSNCSFIPQSEQGKNTRKCIIRKIDGVNYTQRGIAKKYGIHPATFAYRIKRMTLEDAISITTQP